MVLGKPLLSLYHDSFVKRKWVLRKILEILSQGEKAVLHQGVVFLGGHLGSGSDLAFQGLLLLWCQGQVFALQSWDVAPHPHSILEDSAANILEGHRLHLEEAGCGDLVILSQQQTVHKQPEERPLTPWVWASILQDPVELEHVPARAAVTRAT